MLNDDNNVNKEVDDDKGNYTAASWPAYEVTAYVKACVSGAVKNGMSKYDAQSYCGCMQIKIEKRFPDIKAVD